MVIKPKKGQKIIVSGSQMAYELLHGLFDLLEPMDREKEHFWVIGLNRAMRVRYLDWVSMGSMHGTMAEPREVFRSAILHGASYIVLVHNHPSGNVQPSRNDIDLTKILVAGGKILRIKVIDHIILGEDEYYSFNDEGKLEWQEECAEPQINLF